MKKLLSISMAMLACAACQKTEVQTETPEMAAPDAVTGYLVGIGFKNNSQPSLRHGDATLTFNGVTTNQTMVVPEHGSVVTVKALPDPGYTIDYWNSYPAQPKGGMEGERIRERQKTFSELIQSETWYEPVFKPSQAFNDLHIYTNGGGTVTVDPAQPYVDEPFTLTAVPNPGYEFDYWLRNEYRLNEWENVSETPDGTTSLSYSAFFKPTDYQQGVTMVNFQYMVSEPEFKGCKVHIYYTAPNGQFCGEFLTNNFIGHSLAVRTGSSILLSIDISSPGHAPIYCLVKKTDGIIDAGSGGDSIAGDITIGPIDEDCELFVRAELNDFRSEYY